MIEESPIWTTSVPREETQNTWIIIQVVHPNFRIKILLIPSIRVIFCSRPILNCNNKYQSQPTKCWNSREPTFSKNTTKKHVRKSIINHSSIDKKNFFISKGNHNNYPLFSHQVIEKVLNNPLTFYGQERVVNEEN